MPRSPFSLQSLVGYRINIATRPTSIASMAPTWTRTSGSIGRVETRYLDLPEPVSLDCGRQLAPVRIAYETYGELSPARDNVVLVCHALSGDAHAAGVSEASDEVSARDGFAAEDRDGTAGGGRRGGGGGEGT